MANHIDALVERLGEMAHECETAAFATVGVKTGRPWTGQPSTRKLSDAEVLREAIAVIKRAG